MYAFFLICCACCCWCCGCRCCCWILFVYTVECVCTYIKTNHANHTRDWNDRWAQCSRLSALYHHNIQPCTRQACSSIRNICIHLSFAFLACATAAYITCFFYVAVVDGVGAVMKSHREHNLYFEYVENAARWLRARFRICIYKYNVHNFSTFFFSILRLLLLLLGSDSYG